MAANNYHHGNLKTALVLAGMDIISKKGIEGLSLRNVAKQVGVSHTAPYNHFSDKQALLAAISTAGHAQLYDILSETYEKFKLYSLEIIIDVAWAYLQFALDDPGRFKLMFSGALEEEREHPDYLAIAQKNISLFEEIIKYCQINGQLPEGKVEIIAVKIWSLVHGFVNLVLEDQFPTEYLQDKYIKDLLKAVIV